MCISRSRRDEEERDGNHGLEQREPETAPWDFEEMLRSVGGSVRELDETYSWFRKAMIRGLINDPFYKLMDLSTACRMWMMRYMKPMAFVVEVYFQMNLLEYFESHHTEKVLEYFENYYAPDEMVALWERLHPVVEKTESDPPTATAEADQPS